MPRTSPDDSLPATLALLILQCEPFLSSQKAEGSVLRCGEQYWRFLQGALVPATAADYQRAIDSEAQEDWPPYTIWFALQPGATNERLSLMVDVTYDCGITEFSRGGSRSTWQLAHAADGWQILDIEYDMFSD